MEAIKDLVERLNATDECTNIEAKKGSNIHRSIMETVCSFSNEPGLDGGIILLGVERDEGTLFPYYTVTGVKDVDKLTLDLSTQCASMFNITVRPEVESEQLGNGKIAIKVFIAELPTAQKPLYFKNEALPRGAYRRIGSSDQRCTDDDLHVFFNREDTFDSSSVSSSSIDDISEEALDFYKVLRGKVNQFAEELTYNNHDLLQSLGCLKRENAINLLTFTGLLVFGKRQALRRLLPMVRVDYIRVPGNEWIKDPDNRFTTVDMRGPLIELVQRTFNAIADDLPKGFLLPEGHIQAESIGLPSRVLREAIVNAFIHRTYRENQPIQIIRYGNRLEIKNPGFSLKSEDQLGEPGSKNRNPFIAAIFHETNLAETKGSGIRTMRVLMDQAKMAPPTFESDHSSNVFTARLLLHHFLSEEDIKWLTVFEEFELIDAQKRALVFTREAGVIDNSTYRQLNGCDVMKASTELRSMRDVDILEQKGKARATYYVPGPNFKGAPKAINTNFSATNDTVKSLTDTVKPITDRAQTANDRVAHIQNSSNLPLIPTDIFDILNALGKRTNDKAIVEEAILALCKWHPLKVSELSEILDRSTNYLINEYLNPLRERGKLQFIFPEMPNHPRQAYKTV